MNKQLFSLPIILDGENKSSPLKNCIRKNYKHTRKWAIRTKTNCFRIYDRDIKEYPVVIDFYAGRFCVQYFSGKRDVVEPPIPLFDEVSRALADLFSAASSQIFWRTRIKRQKTQQYEKTGESKEFFPVLEYGIKFWINLKDYLDTGLFLDHRETRKYVASQSKGKKMLNLFAYTCSFSVHAAMAGADFTKSVDMSNTYAKWGRNNFKLNSIQPDNHPIVREDCLKFLDEEIRQGIKYDIIVIDPPTLSRSKKMAHFFDVQVEYLPLLKKAFQLLSQEGVIYFSTNSRKFVFDESKFSQCRVMDISKKTIPQDFHNQKIHRCWRISKAAPSLT